MNGKKILFHFSLKRLTLGTETREEFFTQFWTRNLQLFFHGMIRGEEVIIEEVFLR